MSKRGTVKREFITDVFEKKVIKDFLDGEDDIKRAKYVVRQLLDDDEFEDPERISNIIKNRIERGETARDIAYYSHKVLTTVLTHLKIPGRSKMTTKMQMAKALEKYFKKKKKKG